MKVILLTDIPKVGNKYDVKEFKEGYAQNVLLAKGLAVMATSAELAKLADRTEKQKRQKEAELEIFKKLISEVGNQVITIKAKANDKGHLFKAVSAADIANAIEEITKIEIEENSLVVGHIKSLGMHNVIIKKGDKKGECQIKVEAL